MVRKLRVQNMGLFDHTPTGRLMKNVMLAFIEFERNMIVTRTSEGKEVAKANNPEYREGRKKKAVDRARAEELLAQGLSVSAMCKQLGTSRGTWYNNVEVS